MNQNKLEHYYKDIDGWFDFNELYSQMVQYLPNNSTLVELGTFKGKSSCCLLVEAYNSGKNLNLHFCDTFIGSVEHLDETSPFYNDELKKNSNLLYDEFMNNISKCDYPCHVHKCSTFDLVEEFPNNSIDFVFFDNQHDYDHVCKELKLWYPKVKVGGFLGGHDYVKKDKDVYNAVNEFFIEEIHFLHQYDGFTGSYLVQKENNFHF